MMMHPISKSASIDSPYIKPIKDINHNASIPTQSIYLLYHEGTPAGLVVRRFNVRLGVFETIRRAELIRSPRTSILNTYT